MTVYCYDTEFLEDGHTIELISIGIVCEDGREYYAVNSDMPVDRIHKNDWLINNVWRHLPVRGLKTGLAGSAGNIRDVVTHDGSLDMRSTLVKPKWVIRNEVLEFILGGITPAGEKDGQPWYWSEDLPELWAYYGAYDHVVLAQLFGRMIDLPDLMPKFTHDLMQLIEPLNPKTFIMPKQSGDEHHALADARWDMEVLRAAREALKPEVGARDE
ncbi:3'-5' exoribonuclease domain-containing protein [Mycobacterium sp. PSTR-4-N]|uniref:3'-5' exoribonuclease domain-containing protein n=1 Tax=Mycobacterium sp. PSTR-4-N TaxID=2917745 RepID=UPI001F14CF69|nr:3'-5' exoribonuclease [Mycobacterium sp. PSTR-4-N]MCG7592418.1 3'-5' exoribonuclease [Mycobacterium sp. PSTR-4-N]